MLNKYIIIPITLILVSIAANIFLDYYTIPKRLTRIDQSQHFYDMKKWYKSGKLPTTSARFIASQVVNEELTTPRVPGGAYYIFYTLFYKFASESLLGAKIINLIFSLIIISIFLFWVYKKFGLMTLSFITPLILCNGYFVMATTDFWNPNVTLLFSFLFLIFLYEYIEDENDNMVKASAIMIFPILAIMAQGHFVTFFSMIPTVIIYLLIKFKRTLKYVVYWVIGVVISFLEYLPYLISEMQNGFNNTNLIFSVRSSLWKLPFPQMHAITLFPTNEMSVFYGNSIYGSINYWLSYPIMILGLLFLFISIGFSFYCIIRGVYFAFNRKYKPNSNTEKTLLELFRIFLLYVPVTIIFNILAKSKPGTFHYLYNAFAISYIPIILFLFQKKDKLLTNNKWLYTISSLLFINVIVMVLQITTYVKNYEEPRSIGGMKTVAKALLEHSQGKELSIIGVYADDNYMYRDIAVAYFPDMVWNQNNNSTNLYVVLDRIGTLSKPKDTVDEYMQYLNNNADLIGDNGTLFVYKYKGTEPLQFPKRK